MKRVMIPVIAAISLVILGSASGCNENNQSTANAETEVTTEDSATEEMAEEAVPAQDNMKGQKVKISTEFGDMVAVLYDSTPQHRDNFIKLVNDGFYNDLLFHRVMNGFMIQGGDPNSKGSPQGAPLGTGGPGYTVEAEFRPDLIHKKGALAAARQPDTVNPEKRSSGSQYYIVQGNLWDQSRLMGVLQNINSKRDSANKFTYTDEMIETYSTAGGTPFLDQEYTVFGQVIEGLEVIDKIAAVEVDRRNRPNQDVKMTVSLVE